MSSLSKFADMGRKRPTRPCDRCGYHFAAEEALCPHCDDLDDRQVAALRAHEIARQASRNRLGGRFLLLAVVLALACILPLLTR